jgi:hypothetical protein
MKIRISRVTGYRDTTPRFKVEEYRTGLGFVNNPIIINGIQFATAKTREEWLPYEDQSVLQQLYYGGIERWFTRQLSPFDYFVIELERGLVKKAYHESNGKIVVELCDTDEPKFSLEEWLQTLNACAK